MSLNKIDSAKHPVRYYFIEYYQRRWAYKFGILNPMWIPSLRSFKKEVKKLKSDYTLIEQINKESVICLITQPQNKIGRPTIEIFQRLEKI